MNHREIGRQRRYGKQYRKSGRGETGQLRELPEPREGTGDKNAYQR